LALNSQESKVHVIEVATNRLLQDIPVGGSPYEIAFSTDFAYVRSLDSEHVGMIALSRLGQDTALQTSSFTAGTAPPKQVADLGIGTAMAAAVGEAAMLVASPADNLVYYYMEGMLAPSGNFRNPAHSARGIAVVDRSIKEIKPGQYSARVKIPAAGEYDVAFLLESPRLIHCFHAKAAADPQLAEQLKPLEITYLTQQRRAAVGQTLTLKFRIDDPKAHTPKPGLGVKVLYYLAPGLMRTEIAARELGEGVYQADLAIKRAGAYYAYVAVPSEKLGYGDLPVFSLIAAEPVKPAGPR
jgi:YVTN family beta-propeller protein